MKRIQSKWKTGQVPLAEYPRPQMRRDQYEILNGCWDYAITKDRKEPDRFDGQILVPYSPETALSKVKRVLQPDQVLHYRRTISIQKKPEGKRLLLHFGAVDYRAEVLINGKVAVRHRGGYLPFEADITNLVQEGENVLSVRVEDPSDTFWQARGKQTLHPGGMFYQCQSGIWQTVWMEWAPDLHIQKLKMVPDIDRKELRLIVYINENEGDAETYTLNRDLELKTERHDYKRIFQLEDEKSEGKGVLELGSKICDFKNKLDAEGEACDQKDQIEAPDENDDCKTNIEETVKIDDRKGDFDVKAEIFDHEGNTWTFCIKSGIECRLKFDRIHLWSPEDPYLYTMRVTFGKDQVESYFAMRKYSIGKDKKGIARFFLNNRPYFQNGVLDQGYWRECLMTPPSDEAYIFDIKELKRLGFNMIRKHVKIESLRWYYHCDRLGMLVWQDLVNGGSTYDLHFLRDLPNILPPIQNRFPDSKKLYRKFSRASREGRKEYLRELRETMESLDSVVSICTWVLFNEGWGQFDARKVCHLAKRLDPSRTLDPTSGWFDQNCGDYRSIHNYFFPLKIKPERRVTALTEYGGLSLPLADHVESRTVYGYGKYRTKEQLTRAYQKLIRRQILPNIKKGLSALVYTQVSDIEDEVNGIFTWDREVLKINRRVLQEMNRELFEEFETCVEL